MAMASYISRPCFMSCSCVQMVQKLVGRSSGLCAMHARARSTYAPGACSLHEGGGGCQVRWNLSLFKDIPVPITSGEKARTSPTNGRATEGGNKGRG